MNYKFMPSEWISDEGLFLKKTQLSRAERARQDRERGKLREIKRIEAIEGNPAKKQKTSKRRNK